MRHVLLVVRPFGPYAVGDVVGDAKDISKILTGAHAHDVIRVAAPVAAADKREEI